jgi:hypothetical protein
MLFTLDCLDVIEVDGRGGVAAESNPITSRRVRTSTGRRLSGSLNANSQMSRGSTLPAKSPDPPTP